MSSLLCISPIDGRYSTQTQELNPYYSEYGLIKYRLFVEIEYLIALKKVKLISLSSSEMKKLRAIHDEFTITDAQQIKKIESVTNHDVKAVEYFIKEKLESLNLQHLKEFVHFGLTSQDINNTAIPLLWKDGLKVYLSKLQEIIDRITQLGIDLKNIPMLARTHGQSASPTTLGKELLVFSERLRHQVLLMETIPFAAKFGGATGNFNAHHVTYPAIDWVKFANEFVNTQLGLTRMQFTTQIEHYDMLAAHFDNLKRVNTILIDFSRDIWQYISMDYFKQAIKKGEVGSSAMPHKVNPIDFENAEGNLGMANAILEHLSAKLPISRLQRDLTDSTVLRNIGVPMGHIHIAFKSLEKGISKLLVHKEKISADLDQNWAVIAEAIQTILRRENYPNPYEALKDLTRGQQNITQKSLHQFIDRLDISVKVKKELKKITPHNYIGYSAK